VPQLAVRRPLGELDLRDELGPDPVRALVGLRLRLERAAGCFKRTEKLHHPRQLFLVEACSGVAAIDQGLWANAPGLVHAQQQRAEIGARQPRLGPSADDEFLFVNELEFAPVGRALA